MKASDLRIGNWINIYDDYNSEVTGLTNTGKVWFVDSPTDPNCAWNINTIKPIPLTEEWLLKFGFEKHGYGTDEWYDEFNGEDEPFNLKILDAAGHYYYCKMWEDVRIYYVHQLQNLYYALTGEELTIKKEKHHGS